MSNYQCEERHASHPSSVKNYDTQLLRKEFLVESLFERDRAKFIYSYHDRFIIGGIVPVSSTIELLPVEPAGGNSFCERRELGVINLGGSAKISIDDKVYDLGHKEAIYIPRSTTRVCFGSCERENPAILYLNSVPAHTSFPLKVIHESEARIIELGARDHSNLRRIRQLIVADTCQTCQLQMGITELQSGSVWNTMPPHTHSRRMEVYLYTDLSDGQIVIHLMGTPDETRHIIVKNNQAVISPPWSIHSAAGTTNYSFVWGMGGENLNFNDIVLLNLYDLK